MNLRRFAKMSKHHFFVDLPCMLPNNPT
jgi:hypothetical protein